MLNKTSQSQVKRSAFRASYMKADLYPIIDDLKMAHICFNQGGDPISIPMLCWRVDEAIYIHGSRGSRLVKQLTGGSNSCVSFAEFNSWVMAKSAFNHSANYRSAVLFGAFTAVDDEAEQLKIYTHFIEQLEPGRWNQIRVPNDKELKATTLLKMNIGEGAVKVRTGGPIDDRDDLSLAVWAGELPLIKRWGEKIIYQEEV
ncbi:MAG: pyridoxamine 5'-phosphate oxidase family protein [Pseudomonadales bacterium]|nr:pyridoxamine 5'-phosphate oxidase family protein [Pseudomonadales bacterium]